MTEKQKAQFNTMRETLKRIASGYKTTNQIRRSAEREYGLDFEEALEMAYENVQMEARNACKGVRAV